METQQFPQLPFQLRDSDTQLAIYLRKSENFSYFSNETGQFVATCFREGCDLAEQRDSLKKLWPKVLTDALKVLKAHDPRESGEDGDTRAKTGAFFHRGSLGVDELERVFLAFADFEPMLYAASPHGYRDHLTHSFRVWLLGQGLLRSALGGRVYVDSDLGQSISDTETECMWAITALCHDVGYPIANMGNVSERAGKTLKELGVSVTDELRFSFAQQTLPFHESIIRLMSSKPVVTGHHRNAAPQYHTHVQNKYYLKFLKSFDRLDHGVVSALLLSKALVYFLESDMSRDAFQQLSSEDARQFLIRREVLRAIVGHTCLDIYHLRFDTLAFLLYLCDELQSWGRPTWVQMTQSADQRAGDARPQVTGVRVKSYGKAKVSCEIKMTHAKGREVKKQGELTREERKPFKDPIDKLHRILRLAVGTPSLLHARVDFAIAVSGWDAIRLRLADGTIEKEPKGWFDD